MTFDEILAAIPTLSGDQVAVVRDTLPPTASGWGPDGANQPMSGRVRMLDAPRVWCARVYPLPDGRWRAVVRSLRGPGEECIVDGMDEALQWCDRVLGDAGIALRTETR